MARLHKEPIFEEVMCKSIVADLQASKGKVLLDIGANLGLIITYVLQQVPDAHVYAFEPGKKQADLLEKTLRRNTHLSSVILDRRALSDSNGTAKFFVHPSRDYAKDGLRDTKRGEPATSVSVETVTLDAWWEQQGRPHVDVIKMDTEGAELMIIRGATKVLAAVQPTIYLEIAPSNLRAYPYGVKDIIEHLGSIGYHLSSINGRRLTKENADELLLQSDTFRAVFSSVDSKTR